MRIGYRENIYDKDGDINEEGLFIYFGDVTILKLKDELELREIIQELNQVLAEMKEQS